MILVAGGGGFIGRQICTLLTAQGRDVIAVDRRFLSLLPCKIVQGDLSEVSFTSGLFREHSFEAVIQMASLLNTASQKDPLAAMRVNIGASLSLLELAVRFGVPRFIYGSSTSAYGTKRYKDYGSVSESEPAAPEDVYGLSKRYVEVVGENLRRMTGLQFVAVRISTVVGAGAANTASRWRSDLFDKLKETRQTQITIPYRQDEQVPLIHVKEVAQIASRLIEANRINASLYNTPSEDWKFGDLAAFIQSLNPQVEFKFGHSLVRGIPQSIDASRFVSEFAYHPMPLQERLRRAGT